jgi:hypothetical protein
MTTKYEYYNTGDDNYWDTIWSSKWQAQTFTVGATAHTITSVKLLLYRTGNPGTITVSIRATDGSGHPTGSDLTSGTTDGNTLPTGSPYEWREITLTEYTLSANTKYAIVVHCVGAYNNWFMWRTDASSPTYSGGNVEWSSNSGSSWNAVSTDDNMFEVWGNSLAPPAGGVLAQVM